jgi:predicted 2-oxoglutarate/Fe(II)-dependent dioxygenase YbiX
MPLLATELASLLGTVRRPGDFFAAGTAELLAPSLAIEGVGPVALPLLPEQAERIIGVAEAAPYGRGEETVVDPAVRRCWQIGPDQVRLGGRHWAKTLDRIVARAAEGLGVADPVTAEFHKLLVYGPGSFFVGHRDTEKAPGMFATLVVVLPSVFEGGGLLVRHRGREARLALRPDDPAEAAFAAFYADCVHEVLPVTAGHRLTLTYNLVRAGKGRLPEPPDYEEQQAGIAALLRGWRDKGTHSEADVPEKLVYPLDHAYTPAELGFPALKGADAAAAGVLAAAAREAHCDLHLALLTVEESGAAEYADSYGSRRGRWGQEEDAFEAGEVYDRSVTLSEWRHPDNQEAVLGTIPVDEEAELSPPDACDDLSPDEEHFHEATGNEGASFERTYKRAALVLWPSGRLFAVLSQAGLAVTLPYLDDLARRWAESGETHRSELWREAHDLAGHMLAQWPRQGGSGRRKTPSDAARMLGSLTQLDDTDAIEGFLGGVIAEDGFEKDDNDAVIGALGRLPPTQRSSLIEPVFAGTAAICFGACANLLARAAAEWPDHRTPGLMPAATRLVEALPGDPAQAAPRPSWQDSPKVDASVVVDLMTGLCAIDGALAQRAADHLLAWPNAYGLDAVLVPVTRALLGRVGPSCAAAIGALRTACLLHLRTRIAEPLAPPADWTRPAALACRCPRCGELARFLADPERKTWVFKAAEADRRHVEDTIKRAGCDVDTATDRRGRPYSLVCTKNQASYERRAKQRRQDTENLARLAD